MEIGKKARIRRKEIRMSDFPISPIPFCPMVISLNVAVRLVTGLVCILAGTFWAARIAERANFFRSSSEMQRQAVNL